MEKERFFVNENSTVPPIWNSSHFAMEFLSTELNCTTEQLQSQFYNPNWDSPMDQSDHYGSALSSILSSPATSNVVGAGAGGEAIVIRELIGKLGSICNSREVSPSYNNSTNTSCYTTPLNSPPKLNLSIMDHHPIRRNPRIPSEKSLPSNPFSSDPGFAERAARFSCFGNRSFGMNETGNLSRVSSNQSLMKTSIPSDEGIEKINRENVEVDDSGENSSVSEQIPSGEIKKGQNESTNARKRKSIPKGKGKEIPSITKVSADDGESNAKRSKSDETNGNEKDGNQDQKQCKESSKPPEPPKDYIHVRARRGQATDSHSLAERVRREKISERMKFLQDLVPGCNKVTGKAVMLDEIINYVQSLQRQVEFLSMKLATVNPRMDFNMEALLSKEIFQSRGSLPQNIYPLDSTAPKLYQSLQTGVSNGMETQFSVNPSNTTTYQRNPNVQIPPFDETAASQVSGFWEDDLQSVVQMGFGQNQPQSFHGDMKVGL